MRIQPLGVCIAAGLLLFATLGEAGRYCVTLGDTANFTFVLHDASATPGPCARAVANASYNRSLQQTGWDTLDIEGNSSYPANVIARAVGYIEGVLTADRSADWFYNVLSANGSMPMTSAGEAYLKANMEAMDARLAKEDTVTDPYWVNVNLAWQQQLGLIDGTVTGGSGLTSTQVYALAAAGDLSDIMNFADSERRQMKPAHLPPREFAQWWQKNTHCSSLVKVTADLSNLFFGHSTWANFNMMSRIFKNVRPNFPKDTPGVRANTVTYSSWPGALTSVDDFYVTDSGFGVMETTLNVFNFTIYDNCKSSQFLSFIRSAVANRMAANGSHWASIFGRENSGTYNNQWMIVDLNRFTPGQDLANGTLTLVEQLPGKVMSGDVTEVLSRGYWPSYNVAYFKEMFNWAGYPEAIAVQGPQMLDYETCVRANLFRSYQNTVVDAPTMQYMMQYNQYLVDPLELGNPVYAIASRGDLVLGNPGFFGALDTKFTSYADLRANNTIYAFAGPTPQQGVFAWSTFPAVTAQTNIRGLPAQWNFTMQEFHPLR